MTKENLSYRREVAFSPDLTHIKLEVQKRIDLSNKRSQNHIIVYFAMELKDHLVPTPLLWKGHLSLQQVAQTSIKSGLKHFQGQGIRKFSRQLLPVPPQPLSKVFILNT